MWKRIGCGIVAAAGALLMLPRAGANKNFVPDWTFQGSSLGSARTLGSADWRAENGEIVGTPKTAEGGWLILDKPLQDVQFASTFRCSARLPGGRDAARAIDAGGHPRGLRGIARRRKPRGCLRRETRSAGPRGQAGTAQAGVRYGPVPHSAARGRGARRSRARRARRRRTRLRSGQFASKLALHASDLCLPAKRVESARNHPRRQLPAGLDQRRAGRRQHQRPGGRGDREIRTRGAVRRRDGRSPFQASGTEGSGPARYARRRGVQPFSHAAHQRFLLRLVGGGGRYQSRRHPGHHRRSLLLSGTRLPGLARDLSQPDLRCGDAIHAGGRELRL